MSNMNRADMEIILGAIPIEVLSSKLFDLLAEDEPEETLPMPRDDVITATLNVIARRTPADSFVVMAMITAALREATKMLSEGTHTPIAQVVNGILGRTAKTLMGDEYAKD